jgi:hypothetical protein
VVAGVEAALDTRMVQGAGDGDLPAIPGERCRIAEEELRVGALEHDVGTRSAVHGPVHLGPTADAQQLLDPVVVHPITGAVARHKAGVLPVQGRERHLDEFQSERA